MRPALRHALVRLREILECCGHDDLAPLVDDALSGDWWAEAQCGGAIAAAVGIVKAAQRRRACTMDTPLTPQGTPT
jgi:hypothetical protein